MFQLPQGANDISRRFVVKKHLSQGEQPRGPAPRILERHVFSAVLSQNRLKLDNVGSCQSEGEPIDFVIGV